MNHFKDASFPPGPWDPRLSAVACPALQPVETMHENPWFSVRNRGGYFTVEYHATQIAVLPVIEDRWIVMVRVKRPFIYEFTLVVPEGGSVQVRGSVHADARIICQETG